MRRIIKQLLAAIVTFVVIFVPTLTANASAAVPDINQLVSVDSNGNQGNNSSFGNPTNSVVSSNGRYVVFVSQANNLVTGDTNGVGDIFLRDRTSNTTTRVSVSSSGDQADGGSSNPSISSDGRYIVFLSFANNLVPGVADGLWHVYIHDMQTGNTSIVDASSSGTASNTGSAFPSISSNGRFVVFDSSASNLVLGIGNGHLQVFMKDMVTGAIRDLSVSSNGIAGNNESEAPTISCDGNSVAFDSNATNLTSNNSGKGDIYIDDVNGGGNQITDITPTGDQGSGGPKISCDGSKVAYTTYADNLAPNLPPYSSGVLNLNVLEYNRSSGINSVVSSNSNGVPAVGQNSAIPSLSNDGRYVAFNSYATTALDSTRSYFNAGNSLNTFIKDMVTGTTQVISINLAGQGAGGTLNSPSISSDGTFVEFDSQAEDSSTHPQNGVVANDTNGHPDVFIAETGFINTPSAPTNLSASSPTQQPSLSWDDVSDATSYNIYRNGTEIDSSTTNSYIDSNAPEGADSYYVTAVNSSGESGPSNTVNAVVDRTAPNVTGTPTTSPNTNGWYNQDVTINWSSTDPDPSSGTPTQPASTTASTEGDHTYTSGQSCDPANNCATGSIDLKIDKTAPNITYSVTPVANNYGWNNSDVTITFNCSDPLANSNDPTSASGIESCSSPVTLSTEGNNQTVQGTATDKAGNSTTITANVNLDKTAPVITSQLSQQPNSNGWNNTPVTVSYTCTDALSGVQTCADPQIESNDGTYTLSGVATDKAGNTSSVDTTVNIDQTAPTVGTAAWSTNPVQVGSNTTLTVPATDATSGVTTGEYFIGSDPGKGNATPMTYDPGTGNLTATFGSSLTPGVYTIGYRSQDAAGNWSNTSTTMLVVYDTNTTLSMTGKNKKDLIPSLANGDILPGLTDSNQTDAADFGFTVQYKNNVLDPHNDFVFTYDTGTQCNTPHASNCHDFTVNANSFDWLVVSGINNSNGEFQGTATVTVDGTNTINPFTLTGTDGDRLTPSTDDTITLKVYAPGADPNTAIPIYQVSGSMPSQNSVRIQ